MNELVKISPYTEIPGWLHGEIENLLFITRNLIHNRTQKNELHLDHEYHENIWNNLICIVNKLFSCGIINMKDKNNVIHELQDVASGKPRINDPFYLLEILYFKGYLIPDKKTFMDTKDILISFAKKVQVGKIHQINTYAQEKFPDKTLEKQFDHSPYILKCTTRVISIIEAKDTVKEAEYIQNFSDFLSAESILDWDKNQTITYMDTSIEMIHIILLELLLGDYYENNEKMMHQVAQLLSNYFENSKNEEYVLNYIAQYTDDIFDIT